MEEATDYYVYPLHTLDQIVGLRFMLSWLIHFDQALDAAAEARSIMEQIGDEHGIAFALHSSGRARAGSGQLSAAVTDLIAAIQLRRRIDDRYGAGRSLMALGDAYTALDRPADARGAWLEALALFDELDAPERSDVQEKLDR